MPVVGFACRSIQHVWELRVYTNSYYVILIAFHIDADFVLAIGASNSIEMAAGA